MNTEIMRICINCKVYLAGETEVDDICLHEKAVMGGIRSINNYHCGPMLSGICEKNKLFEAKDVVEK